MKVNGNISGLKQSLLSEIEKLYDMQVPSDAFISYEMMFALADFSAQINREISVYLSRQGRVHDISIGSSVDVPLPFLRIRRGNSGLSGIRCIHTHPGGSPMLSPVDIGTLLSTRMDAMAAIGINKQGRVTGLGAAVIGENLTSPKHLGPFKVGDIPLRGLMGEIQSATERVRRAISLTETKGETETAVLVGLNASEQSMNELKRLAKTVGAEVIDVLVKKRPGRDRKNYIGKGNLAELNLLLNANNADIVIVNDELSSTEQTTLEETLFVKIIDRTALILDIFASHA
ncbi:MAG: GTPase HflX, partial [Eubacteriales bacterium]